ncbi:hypothetical protein DFH09DRAFT_1144389 [Mycena vulgaris]|nr:hypothetical protein DFH09DRAFT_1144389 [Mycena vulgaris]
MPPELPGLYFDVARNRYFPIASRPPPTPAPPQTPAEKPERPRRRRRVLWSAGTSMPLHHAQQSRISESLLLDRLAETRCGRVEHVRWPVGESSISAFRTATVPDAEGHTRQWLGDPRGWVYSRTSTSSSDDDEAEWTPWMAELCLHPDSEISALCTSGARCVAVCFGPATKICVQDAGVPGRICLLSLSAVRDVRDASLQGNSLVLGAARKAVLLSDIDAAPPVRTLDTGGSDVFAVAQHGPLIYAGTRAGSALLFDTRLPSAKCTSQLLLDAPTSARSSIVSLHPMQSASALLVACADGRLASYDLRFARAGAAPAVTYAGNVGAVGARLGLTLDSTERVLFAAGADCRLRAWAVGSGAPIHAWDEAVSARTGNASASRTGNASASRTANASASRGANAARRDPGPFAACFGAPLAALQVVDGVLWAGGGGEVGRWRLGV